MKQFEATEIAYKNGYEKGYEEAANDFAERVKRVIHLCIYDLGDKNDSDRMEKCIDQIVKDMAKGTKK